MNVVEWISLILFALGGVIAFLPRVDVRAAFVCFAIAGALLTLDVGGVINS
jgi:hypothetical protein